MPADMNDSETAHHLREWVKLPHGVFAWPTDACGYEQSIRFSKYRNENWNGEGNFCDFILGYAELIDTDTSCGWPADESEV